LSYIEANTAIVWARVTCYIEANTAIVWARVTCYIEANNGPVSLELYRGKHSNSMGPCHLRHIEAIINTAIVWARVT
jgi:hypothetical protein